jgi:hypothetical protein
VCKVNDRDDYSESVEREIEENGGSLPNRRKEDDPVKKNESNGLAMKLLFVAIGLFFGTMLPDLEEFWRNDATLKALVQKNAEAIEKIIEDNEAHERRLRVTEAFIAAGPRHTPEMDALAMAIHKETDHAEMMEELRKIQIRLTAIDNKLRR